MKKKKGMLLALIIMVLASSAQAQKDTLIVSLYVSSAPVIDADLSDWDTSRFIDVTPSTGVFDGESGTTDDPADQSFSFGVANDDQYLYVAVIIYDNRRVLDSCPDPDDKAARAWMDDAVEIFIDGDHSASPDARDPEGVEYKTGGEFSIVANGAVTSNCSGVPEKEGDPNYWEAAGSYGPSPAPAYQRPWDDSEDSFIVEARFNYAIMGDSVGPESVIGFTVSAHDDDDGGGRDTALYWKGISPHCWKDEGGWADLLLSKPPASVPTGSWGKKKSNSQH